MILIYSYDIYVFLLCLGCTLATLWDSSLGQNVLGVTALAVGYTLKILKLDSRESFLPKMAKR